MTTYDVLIVGGGIIGLSIARYSAKAGMRVCVVERDQFGCATTAVSAGMLAPNCEANPAERELFKLASKALLRWPGFAAQLHEETKIDVDYRDVGTFIVARDSDEMIILEREASLRRELGYEPTLLLAQQARRLEPGLAPTITGALHIPEDHAVDPRKVTRALYEYLRTERAVTLRSECQVEQLFLGDGCDGVLLRDGEHIVAHNTVIAAGVWSGEVMRDIPVVSVPVAPVKGQILRFAPFHSWQRSPVERTIRYASGGGYIVPRSDGSCTVGATVEEQGFDTHPTGEGIYKLLEATMEIVPAVLELALQEVAAGLRPATPDNRPLIGKVAGIERLFLATGHYRNGILLAPLTAELTISAIQGKPLPEVLDPNRFSR